MSSSPETEKQSMSSDLAAGVEHNRAKILKLEGKTDTWFEISDANYRKNIEITLQLRNDMERKFKKLEVEFHSETEKLNAIIRDLNERKDEEEKATTPPLSSVVPQATSEEERPNGGILFPDLSFDCPQMTCFDLALNNNKYEPVLSWKVPIEKLKARNLMSALCSDRFTWSDCPASQAQAEILEFADVAQLSLRLFHSRLDDVGATPTFYCVLKDQRGSGKHRTRSATFSFTMNSNSLLGFDRNFLDPVCFNREDSFLYNANSLMEITIYIEPLSLLKTVPSYDGTLNWAIEQYGKKKKWAEEELVRGHESPYFYTGPQGYRVRVSMRLDEMVEQERGLVAKIEFLKGEFDHDLPATFNHSATVTLINRKNSNGNVSKTVERNMRDDPGYFIAICGDKKIKDLIENDTLYYNVTIK